MNEIAFDEARADDAAEIAALAGQLGYPCTAADIRARLARLATEPTEQVRVARQEGKVVAWVHFHLIRSLSTDPRVEIAGIVVDERLRGQGIGARLVGLAEAWGRSQGLTRIRLASRATRADAHRLYLKLGYAIIKTSHFFEKPLSADERLL
jgi:GNAT superfamily N-acetyltransferase